MNDHLVAAPLLVALVSAVVTLLLQRWPRVQQAASVAGVVGYAVAVTALTRAAILGPDAPGAVAYQVAGWSAPFGITMVVDGLSAFMLAITAVVALPALVFSVRYVEASVQNVFYHPLFHLLLVGVTGAFLTGDLFNLFVWFEVMLMTTYVFVVFYGGPQHTSDTFRYLSLNIAASAFLLVAIGGLYATTGTLNLADMARRLADPAAYGVAPEPVVGLSALLLAVFALKAGLVPFQFWVPGAYRSAPFPVVAVLAGASKKVGVYAIVRMYFTVFDAAEVSVSLPGVEGSSPLAFFGPVLLVMAGASILVGGLGAVYAGSIEEMLAYSSIGQVGFIVVPLAVGATAGAGELRQLSVLAALVYALNHSLSKGTLFLLTGTVRKATDTSRFSELGGLASRSPVLAGVFFVGTLSLVGIPPLAGFFGKMLVFDVAAQGRATAALGTLLVGSVLTIGYTSRAWNSGFWGSQTLVVEDAKADPVQVAVLVALTVGILLVGAGFDPVYRFAETAAEAALDTGAYVEAVDPAGPGGGDA